MCNMNEIDEMAGSDRAGLGRAWPGQRISMWVYWTGMALLCHVGDGLAPGELDYRALVLALALVLVLVLAIASVIGDRCYGLFGCLSIGRWAPGRTAKTGRAKTCRRPKTYVAEMYKCIYIYICMLGYIYRKGLGSSNAFINAQW